MEHAAILYTDEPFHKVFREFLDIFDKYYAWYEHYLKIIIENKDVSDLLDYATTFLYNPIALFSPTGKLLHYTGKFQEKIEGTLWDEVINFGFTPTESIYPDEQQMKIYRPKAFCIQLRPKHKVFDNLVLKSPIFYSEINLLLFLGQHLILT